MTQGLYSRRRFAAATGTTVAGVLAGCSSSNNSNEGTGQPQPEYSLVAETPDEIDLVENNSLELEMYVERTLEEETEVLDPENLEITGYTVRDHPDYDEELLKQAGLHKEISTLEHLEDNYWKIPGEDVLAGNTALNFDIQVDDPEYSKTEKLSAEETLSVQKTPEEILEDTWVEDEETYQILRNQHTTQELENGVGGQYETWMELGEAAMQTAEEKWNADQKENDREDQLQDYAGEWIQHAGKAIGGTGQPSGQANYLAFTLEQHLDNVTAGQMTNRGHYTVLLHHHGENKTYHVETGRGGLTHHPPKEAGFPYSHKNETPLWTTENNLPKAKGTLIGLTQVNDEHWAGKNRLGNNYTINAMTELREGNGGQVIETMQNLVQTLELNPSQEYRLEREPSNPEIKIQ